ncbi:ABC transporter [Novosphingobium colocasiae]
MRPAAKRHRRGAFAVLLAACLAACGGSQGHDTAENTTAGHEALNARVAASGIGLFTSLPILWAEADGPGELLAGGQARHWLRDALPPPDLAPLDVLADADGRLPLPSGGTLIMAQPRPLAAVENVALDAWVRGGGHLLLFADPMLTAHSRFAIGDPRRPQDIVLLSPILAHWGAGTAVSRGPTGEGASRAACRTGCPGRPAGAFRANRGKIRDAGSRMVACWPTARSARAGSWPSPTPRCWMIRRIGANEPAAGRGIRALLARVTSPR